MNFGSKMRLNLLLAVLSAGLGSSSAIADATTAVPTAWRLQEYLPNNVVVWFTGSPCSQGQVAFPSGTSADDVNRFFSMVLSAKLASHSMTIDYTNQSGTCFITDYYMDG